MINFQIFTIFPELFPGPLSHSVTGKALGKKIWSYKAINIRNYATDKHQTVDDYPYGGGAGMILKPDVISNAFKANSVDNKSKIIYLSPRGKILNQAMAVELSKQKEINLLCGRYEGIDQRVLDKYEVEEVSIGDYILSGGEIASYIMIDAIIRNIDGVLGSKNSVDEESFDILINNKKYKLIEYDQYTKPEIWNNKKVSEVLLSGNHEKIRRWRETNAIHNTKKNRPDLYNEFVRS